MTQELTDRIEALERRQRLAGRLAAIAVILVIATGATAPLPDLRVRSLAVVDGVGKTRIRLGFSDPSDGLDQASIEVVDPTGRHVVTIIAATPLSSVSLASPGGAEFRVLQTDGFASIGLEAPGKVHPALRLGADSEGGLISIADGDGANARAITSRP